MSEIVYALITSDNDNICNLSRLVKLFLVCEREFVVTCVWGKQVKNMHNQCFYLLHVT